MLQKMKLQVLTWPAAEITANNRGLEAKASDGNKHTAEPYSRKGDGWRLKWHTLKTKVSRVSDAIYLGIITLLTNACQGVVQTDC